MKDLSHNTGRETYQYPIDEGYQFHFLLYIKKGILMVWNNIANFFVLNLVMPFIVGCFLITFTIIALALCDVLRVFQLSHYFVWVVWAIYLSATYFVVSMVFYAYFYTAKGCNEEEGAFFADWLKAFSDWKQLFYFHFFYVIVIGISILALIVMYKSYVFLYRCPTCIRQEWIEEIDETLPYLLVASIIVLFCVYYTIIYSLTPLLILFGRFQCKEAMQISRKLIMQHFFWFSFFYLILAIMVFLGLMCFVIGVFVTLSMATAIMYIAYDEIMREKLSSIEVKISEIGNA